MHFVPSRPCLTTSRSGSTLGPLFQYRDGRVLTRPRFSEAVCRALHKAGVDYRRYNTHSFMIRAATTAATRGFEDSLVTQRLASAVSNNMESDGLGGKLGWVRRN